MKFFFLFLFLGCISQAKVTSVLTQEELSVCNAGLSHESINPSFKGGIDRLNYQFEDNSVPETSEAHIRSGELTVNSGDTLQTTFDQSVEVFEQNLLQTNFNLTTESYGSTYFVDLCYRGSIEKKENNSSKDESEGIYTLDLAINIDQDPNALYAQQAGLIGYVNVQCDLRAKGQKRGARKGQEKKPDSFEIDLNYTSDIFAVRSSSIQLSLPLNDNLASVPRFCRFRLTLSETQNQTVRQESAYLKEVDINLNIDQE